MTLHGWLAKRLPHGVPGLISPAGAFPLVADHFQFVVDLRRLDKLFEGQELGDLPGLPPGATRRRQIEYLGGRLCAERALAQADSVPVMAVPRGLHGQPVWPSKWQGSITHTATHAYAAALQAPELLGLGIDAELVVDTATGKDILTNCAVAFDIAQLNQFDCVNEAATLLFAAKEAYYKCVFALAGKFIDFDEVVLASVERLTGNVAVAPAPHARFDGVLPVASGRFRIAAGTVFVALETRRLASS